MTKNLPANAGDVRNSNLIPGLERSPGRGHGNLLQSSCLEKPLDRGAWQATAHGVAKSWTQLSDEAQEPYYKKIASCMRGYFKAT